MANLEAELAALKARVAELEARGRPAAPFKAEPAPQRDLTERASMPPSALREMATAVPSVVIREIANGDRVPAQLAPLARDYATPSVAQRGWRSPAALDVPGIALADRMMDVADRADRVELAQRLAKQELARRAAKGKPDAAA